jgi:hypothetical protein
VSGKGHSEPLSVCYGHKGGCYPACPMRTVDGGCALALACATLAQVELANPGARPETGKQFVAGLQEKAGS